MSDLPLRTIRLCLLVTAAVAASPEVAHAQSRNSGATQALAIAIGPPLVGAALCDLGTLFQLTSSGTARRGFTITGVALSGAGMLTSGLMMLLSFAASYQELLVPAAAGLGFAAASLGLNLYGISRPPTDLDADPAEQPLVLRGQPVKLYPLFGGRAEERLAGIAVFTTW